ncbi:hypothetical protein AKO1_005384 [Acrasis kona]|uniref:BSD domain-containing protein n=1 Tax=Acrasis kona TaxID=1008807 RepID=A0AAW2YK71_9EUKA
MSDTTPDVDKDENTLSTGGLKYDVSSGISQVNGWFSSFSWTKVKEALEQEVKIFAEEILPITNQHAPFDDRAEVPSIWIGKEKTYRKWLSKIALDVNTFLVEPDDGLFNRNQFGYNDLIAEECLQDEALSKVRYTLVPKFIPEEDFWNNYFYRVHLIKTVNDVNNTKAVLVKANTVTEKSQEKLNKYNKRLKVNTEPPKSTENISEQEVDSMDYESLTIELHAMKDNISLLQSVLSTLEQQDVQDPKKLELLQDLMRTVVRNKEKLATTLPHIIKESAMNEAMAVNDLLHNAIVSYRKYMTQKEEKQKEQDVKTQQEPTEEPNDQHLNDLENDDMAQLRRELGIESLAPSTTPTSMDTTTENETRLPWEDEDDE